MTCREPGIRSCSAGILFAATFILATLAAAETGCRIIDGDLPEGVPARDAVPGIGTQGLNDFRKVGHGGPCPRRGPAHRYFFKLYALDAALMLPPRKTKADLLKAIEGHVLAQAELMGRYKRK